MLSCHTSCRAWKYCRRQPQGWWYLVPVSFAVWLGVRMAWPWQLMHTRLDGKQVGCTWPTLYSCCHAVSANLLPAAGGIVVRAVCGWCSVAVGLQAGQDVRQLSACVPAA